MSRSRYGPFTPGGYYGFRPSRPKKGKPYVCSLGTCQESVEVVDTKRIPRCACGEEMVPKERKK